MIEDADFRFPWHVSDAGVVSAPALSDQYTGRQLSPPSLQSTGGDTHSRTLAITGPVDLWQLLSIFNNFYLLN